MHIILIITIAFLASLPPSTSSGTTSSLGSSFFPGFASSSFYDQRPRRRRQRKRFGALPRSVLTWNISLQQQNCRRSCSRTNHYYYELFSTSSHSSKVEEISLSSSNHYDDALIEAARKPLPWEHMIENDDDNNNSSEGGKDTNIVEDIMDDGERWIKTRQLLAKLKILPKYNEGNNHNQDEEGNALLSKAPQLLRLPTIKIKATAKTATSVLKLSPAILRYEPLLLTMPPDLLVLGFDALVLDWAKDMECGDLMEECDIGRLECAIENIKEEVRKACEERAGLLLEAATKCCNESL